VELVPKKPSLATIPSGTEPGSASEGRIEPDRTQSDQARSQPQAPEREKN